ncbi:MAG: prephenate dehydrogenase [Candidatus Pacebacteria bacterium]|nr:prephenate dehydrogenase [Candidatus Paceibacterota bacterium]
MKQAQPSRSKSEETPAYTVAIVGLGLLGGSLALALRRLRTPKVHIMGCARREESVADALRQELIDSGSTDPEDVLPHAALTVVCLPVTTIIDFIQKHAKLWGNGSIVTDVGSVKSKIVAAATPILQPHGVSFVGSHPMAGSERTGMAHAKADLYDNAVVFVTPQRDDNLQAVDNVERFWELTGARTRRIDPVRHDALVARTSHLPHVLAAAMVRVVLKDDKALLGTAGAFRDVSRIAASSPEMWRQIFELNQDEVLQAVDEYVAELNDLRTLLAQGQWRNLELYLSTARNERQEWFSMWQHSREAVK